MTRFSKKQSRSLQKKMAKTIFAIPSLPAVLPQPTTDRQKAAP
jgi:hypothetical protein